MRQEHFPPQPPVKPGGTGNEPVAVVEETVPVHEEATVLRRAAVQRARQADTDPVAFERERLDIGALLGGRQIFPQPRPELSRAHQELDVHSTSVRPAPTCLAAHARAPNLRSLPVAPVQRKLRRRMPNAPAARLTP
jgi:hypothetical protein